MSVEPVPNSARTVALTATAAATSTLVGASMASALAIDPLETLVVTEFEDLIASNPDSPQVSFDLDGDGNDDFAVGLKGDEFGYIFGLKNLFSFNLVVADTYTKFAVPFGPGDIISEDVIGGSTQLEFGGILYSEGEGPLNSVGDSIFVGLFLEFYDTEESHFGWAELTRGSLQINSIGFQTVAGLGAPIPSPIPVPASLALLASGAAGLAAYRRRGQRATPPLEN